MASRPFLVDSSFRGVNEIVLNNYAKKTQPSPSKLPYDIPSSTDYSQSILRTLNNYRKATTFCDVCLLVEDEEIMAHRNVLAASSPFFESLLSTSMREKEQYRISLAGLKASVFKEILDYMYLGEITFSLEKACDLIEAADYLMISRLKKLSVNHLLTEHLNFENCLSLWLCGDRFQCSRLRNKARELVLANFYHISTTDEFRGFDVSYLLELLHCEELAASDKEAFDAILAWISHNANARVQHFEQLIGNIELQNLPTGYIDYALARTHFAKNNDILKCLVKHGWQCFENGIEGGVGDVAPGDSVTHYGNVAVVVVGGWAKGKGGIAHVNCYLPSVNQWFKLSNMNIPRYRHGIAVHDGIVYALGGSVAADDSCVECLDFNHPEVTWRRLLPMCSGLLGAAVTSLNGYIYVSGGFCGKTLNTAQRYSPSMNTWESVSPMMQAREGHCLIACSNFVYAIGGSCGQDNSEVLKGVERYDPCQDSWSPVSPMKTQRNGACGIELHQQIFIIGGQFKVYTDGPMIQTNFRSCEVYSPKTDQWDMIAELKFPRLRSCAAVVGHKIYVFGGFLHGGYLDTVECYDSNKGCWSVAGNSPAKLEGAACCAVHLGGKTISHLLLSKSGK